MRGTCRGRSVGMVAAAIGLALALAFAPLDAAPAAQGDRPDLLVFAAASLQTALDELTPQVEAATGVQLRASYAASSTLARQIENGAPADIFISADERWMDDVANHGAILPSTRADLLGNALVLVAPAGSKASVDLAPGAASLLSALGRDGRLAIALPDSVPAGIYAKQSLARLGMWSALQPRMAMARDVRAALNLVVLGQCPLGIVYRSDAVSEARVKVLATFPADSHKPVVYPAAIVREHDNAGVRALLAALESGRAAAVFRRRGFDVLVQ